MNKTITANIGGMVFHIDEDAYHILKKYLDKLASYFATQDEGREIAEDIELRIAEMLIEQQGDQAIIATPHVMHVMKAMGTPEELADESGATKNAAYEGMSEGLQDQDRKLFRDPDKRIIGGICSGIAAYFGISPVWIRIIMVLLVFVYGTSALVYFILWLVIPKAESTADKLRMHGKAVTISNIEQSVKEEWDSVKSKAKEYSGKANKNNIDSFFTDLGGIIRAGARILVVMIAIIMLIVVAFIVFTVLTSGGIAALSLPLSIPLLGKIIFISQTHATFAVIGVLLVVLIPIIGTIISAARYVFNKKRHNAIGISLTVAWVLGWVIVFASGTTLAREFAVESNVKRDVVITDISSDTLYIKPSNAIVPEFKHYSEMDDYSIYIGNAIFRNDTFWTKTIDLDIDPSADDNFYLVVKASARGRDVFSAKNLAQEIRFNLYQIEDTLFLDEYLSFAGSPFRDQEIELTLEVPDSVSYHVDRALRSMTYNYHYRYSHNNGHGHYNRHEHDMTIIDGNDTIIMNDEEMYISDGDDKLHIQYD